MRLRERFRGFGFLLSRVWPLQQMQSRAGAQNAPESN